MTARGATVVTVGTFDGIHRGHQAVLAEIAARARASGRESVVVTFEPHPLVVVAPERAPCLLTTADEKRLLWPLFGLDHVDVVPFTQAVREMSPETFVRRVLVERWNVGELVIGYDHGFGKDRAGDVETLRRIGAEAGFRVDVVGPVAGSGGPVSSSAIRRAVADGDLAGAAAGLGRPYSAAGRVVPGAGRGRGLGFPTANVALADPAKCLPPLGVYAVRAAVEGRSVPGMANLGARPTFGEEATRLEVHLLDWEGGDLAGKPMEVAFVERLRDVRRFAGPDDLAGQLGKDRERARAALADPAPGVARAR